MLLEIRMATVAFFHTPSVRAECWVFTADRYRAFIPPYSGVGSLHYQRINYSSPVAAPSGAEWTSHPWLPFESKGWKWPCHPLLHWAWAVARTKTASQKTLMWLMEITSLEPAKAEQKLLNKKNNLLVFQQSFLCNIDSCSHSAGAVLLRADCSREKWRTQGSWEKGALTHLAAGYPKFPGSFFGSTTHLLGDFNTMWKKLSQHK